MPRLAFSALAALSLFLLLAIAFLWPRSVYAGYHDIAASKPPPRRSDHVAINSSTGRVGLVYVRPDSPYHSITFIGVQRITMTPCP